MSALSGVSIRLATPSDLDAIMVIERASFPDDAWSRSAMAADLASEHTEYRVVEDDERTIIGYGGILAPARSNDADVQTIALDSEVRGRGIGRRLMVDLLSAARSRGAAEVFLEVRADNPGARALYDSLGFAEIAVRPRYYQPAGVDAIVMRASVDTTPQEER